MGLSINMLTLLALVMAIGLVVDDAIVVLENIHRRIEEEGETPLVAAYRGTRQVGFAVVATTMVLDRRLRAHHLHAGPDGPPVLGVRDRHRRGHRLLDAGRADHLADDGVQAAEAARRPQRRSKRKGFAYRVDRAFAGMRKGYGWIYDRTVSGPIAIAVAFVAILAGSVALFTIIPGEYTPQEDRGSFQMMITGPGRRLVRIHGPLSSSRSSSACCR